MNFFNLEKIKSFKYFRITGYTVIFIFFVILGFFIFQIFTPLFFPKSPKINTPAPAVSDQKLLLLIHAENLASTKPQLISAWVLLISNSNPAKMIAKSIFPDISLPSDSRNLSSTFSYNPQTGLSPSFLREIKTLNLNLDGYIILDQVGLNQLFQWTNPASSPSRFSIGAKEASSILADDGNFLTEICKQLGKTEAPLHWSNLLPDHMDSDLSFRDMAILGDKFSLSYPNQVCKVITTP